MSRAPELTRLAAPSTRRSCARRFIEVSMIMKLFTATLQNLQVRLGLQGGLSASCPTSKELDHVRPSRQVALQMSPTRKTR